MSDLQSLDAGHIMHPGAYEAAVKRNILHNARTTYIRNTPDFGDIFDFLMAREARDARGSLIEGGTFLSKMAYALDTYGKLTPNQTDAVRRSMAQAADRKAEWADKKAALNAKRVHLGEVGAKLTVTLTIVHVVTLESAYGTSYLYICEDADQNVVVYKGNSGAFFFKADGDGLRGKGDSLTVTAVVKEHGVRDGVKQTVIQRPKLVG